MQFEFICKIKLVLFTSVIIYNEFQCINVLVEFLQTDRTGPVTELSLFSTGCMVFLPLSWVGVFKYSYVKWMFCSSSCILCCRSKFFSSIFNTKFCAYYLSAVLIVYREQATVALVSVPLTLHLLSGGWNILAHFHFCLCCSWIVATLHSD